MYDYLLVSRFDLWSLYIHANQFYLGRCYLWCHRQNAIDFLSMTEEEKEEFFLIAKNLKASLHTLFSPDLMNYASLGNVANHLHIHIIPRYKSKRVYKGYLFNDNRWGKNYAPYPKDFSIPKNILFSIRDDIAYHYKRNQELSL